MPTPDLPPPHQRADGDAAPDAIAISDGVLARVARDVHNSVGQSLFGASMLAAALAADLRESPHRAEAERLEAVVRAALDELRQFALGLDPIDMADLGVARALERTARDASEMFGVKVELAVEGCETLSTQAALDVVRITQEAITNAVRHGEAERVEVALHCDACRLELTVTDDGRGIADDAVEGVGVMGLETMRARARRLGGAFDIRLAPGGGTVVRILVPDLRSASSASTEPR